jgi:hypothetical protein
MKDGRGTVLYNAGDCGFLYRCLVHKIKKHDGGRAVILTDCQSASPETKRFFSDWNGNNGSGCDLVMYSGETFLGRKTEDETERTVTEYFDKVLQESGIDLKSAEHIYSGCGGPNAFEEYLRIRDVKYTAADGSEDTDPDSLSEEEKKRLLGIYGLNDISLKNKSVLIPLKPYSSVKYSDVKDDLSPFQKLLRPYRMAADCLYGAEYTVVLKVHPDCGMPEEVAETFPGSVYLGGYIPNELLGMTDIRNADVLSIGGCPLPFSVSGKVTVLPENFFSVSSQTFAMFLSDEISKALFGNDCRIYFENNRDRIMFSSFFSKLRGHGKDGRKKFLTVIADSKKISDIRIKEMLDLLDSDTVIVLHNPDVRMLPRDFFVTYFRVRKKEHFGPDIAGSCPVEYMAVLYSDPKYRPMLENFVYLRHMSRCGLDLVMEPTAGRKSGGYEE